MRRTLIKALVCFCVGSFAIPASAQRSALAVAALGVAPIDVRIVEGTTRDRVFALLGQPWIVDRENNRWVYPTQTVMFKGDVVTGIMDSDPGRVTGASDDAKQSPAAKRKTASKRKPATTARKAKVASRGSAVRRNGSNQSPFRNAKNTFFKKVDRPEMMRRSSTARRSYSPVYSPYQAGRYGHNLSFGQGKRVMTRRNR